ncbi:amino acid/polyamine/organocation transporter (APC superfamily) [Scopulibacillus darangshiensis]|uniref:Amino acid/polyamine/organocation transporter (APC superfamily) n=2 Tax=Scopulibacillus darangshiensis TaxID=442528 RepID=A0A4R2P7G5_9BACL|nr:amino acid/polyamine/organocation transporter (APC superfamily) [Scopulibacillus darangshiensis]
MVATAVGIVVSSSAMVSLGQGFGIAGPGFLIPMVIAMVLNLFVAFSFAELASIIPRAGGINHYTLPTMGPFIGMVSVLSGYVLVNMFAGSAEAHIAGTVIHGIFAPDVSPLVISAIFLIILSIINIRGIEFYSWSQMILTGGMIVSLVIIGIIGLTGTGSGEPLKTSIDFNSMGWGVVGLFALAFWLFVGIEFVCPMAEEVKKPKLYIPLSMILGLLIILVVDLIFGNAAIKYVPLNILAGSESPHVKAATAILGKTGQIWIGIVTVFATGSTINTLICSIPRMLYSMAQKGQMPQIFGKLNRWGSPWAGIVFLSSLFLVFLIGISGSASITTFILAGAFCWMITYIVAHLNVIIMRVKYPNAARTFKSPLGLTFQIIGIFGIIYMMFNIFPDPAVKQQIYMYAVIFLLITVVYSAIWVKFAMKKKLFETTPIEELLKEGSDSSEGYITLAENKNKTDVQG